MESNELWYPPQLAGYGPLIEGRPTEAIGHRTKVQTLLEWERENRRFAQTCGCYWDGDNARRCVAHCVALPAEKLEPTTDEIEATQTPWSLQQDADDAAADEANRPMFDRDLIEPATKPQPVAVVAVEPEPWHLRCAAWTNRFGGWGAAS